MLKKIFIAIALFFATQCYSQTLGGYFRTRGVAHLSQAAHVSNLFQSGTYNINANYVTVEIKSWDKLFERYVKTKINVYRGVGDLYFNRIQVTDDEDDIVPTFDAFGLQASLMATLISAIDRNAYNKIKNSLIQIFNTDISQWTGTMWALFAINLDYYDYMLSGK